MLSRYFLSLFLPWVVLATPFPGTVAPQTADIAPYGAYGDLSVAEEYSVSCPAFETNSTTTWNAKLSFARILS
jgi:hypothetical protein